MSGDRCGPDATVGTCVFVGGCGYMLGDVLISADKRKGTEQNGIDEIGWMMNAH